MENNKDNLDNNKVKFNNDTNEIYPFRKNAAAIIVNFEKKILMCEHIWIKKAWQFPQGGIEEDEEPVESLFRELYEELGVKEFKVIDKMKEPLKYYYPKYLRERYKSMGQEQIYFMLYFYGDEKDIRFDNQPKPEFQSFQWVNYNEPPKKVIFFKRKAYQKALDYFKETYKKLDPVQLEKEIKKEKKEGKEDYKKYLDFDKAHTI